MAVFPDPEYTTDPAICVVPFFNMNVDELIEAAFIDLLKVAAIILFRATLVAPLVGSVEITVGILPVEKLQT